MMSGGRPTANPSVPDMNDHRLQAFIPDLVRLGGETRLGAGAVLFREGDPGDSVAVLLEGLLEVVHEAPDGEEAVLRTLEPGTVVGEMAAVSDGRTRSATVRARTACRVVKVPALQFRELLKQQPELLLELYLIQVDRVRGLTRQVAGTHHHRSITDPVTHVYNFAFFKERLELEIGRARQTKDPVALALFELDHFEPYSDRNGEKEAQAALITVAEILKGASRRGDIVARYGSKEFVALLYGTPRDEAIAFAEAVRGFVASRKFPGGEEQPGGHLTVSAGVAIYPIDARTDEELVKAADICLYQAIEGGRNLVKSGAGAA
jgi:diguanylate cyclase (GGDEF)-like protein